LIFVEVDDNLAGVVEYEAFFLFGFFESIFGLFSCCEISEDEDDALDRAIRVIYWRAAVVNWYFSCG
jgi:hypothetical protein